MVCLLLDRRSQSVTPSVQQRGVGATTGTTNDHNGSPWILGHGGGKSISARQARGANGADEAVHRCGISGHGLLAQIVENHKTRLSYISGGLVDIF